MTATRTATFVGWTLVFLMAAPPHLLAQAEAPLASPQGRVEVWRHFAQRVDPGKTLRIRLIDGPRFTATLLQVSDEGMIVQPKTRAAVPPQQVPFDRVETLEVDQAKGVGIGKAVALGAAVGAGAWLALMAFAFAVWGD